MPDSPLVEAARQWVIATYTYNSHHLVKALEWLDRIALDATEAMRLATLTHDMERAFPGPDQPVQAKIDGLWQDDEYNKVHSSRSARIVGEWLQGQKAPEELINEVKHLIIAHEIGGWPEANLVQAADSLSFLETNIDLFLDMARTGKRTLDEVAVKFFTTYWRIQVPQARELALPMYEAAKERVKQLSMEAPKEISLRLGMLTYPLLDSDFQGLTLEQYDRHVTFDLKPQVASIKMAAKLLQRSLQGDMKISDARLQEITHLLGQSADRAWDMLASVQQYIELRKRYVPQKDQERL